MTQKDKELLLKDLCARIPYKVKAQYYDLENECETWDEVESVGSNGYVEIGQYSIPVNGIKPYLFPFENMTEEQEKEYLSTCNGYCTYYWTEETFDWLNKNHFDYRGLISKGLANDATGLDIY